jgi:Zn-dependent protease with chaperone function
MRLRKLALLFCLMLPLCGAARASETPAEHAASVAAQQEMDAAPPHGNLPDYSLPPDKLATAQHLTAIRDHLNYIDIVWGVLQIALLLWLGVVAWMRDTAVRITPNRWGQGFVFVLLFLLANFILNLPVSLYGHHLGLKYGLSVQRWPSWFLDRAKDLGVSWLVGGLLVMLLFFIIRSAPKRWWVIFWAVSIPISLAGTYATPYIYDPLFHKFEPLQKTNPALVEQLEKVVARGNMNIPPERMFLMKASEKTNTMNAYVTGFGGSKRMVVWDTTLAKATPDEVLMIFGHESGHYVLGHIVSGIAFTVISLFLVLYLGYRFVQWAIGRFGARWRIPSQDDWGALGVLLLAMSLLSVMSGPIENTWIRHHEHDADVYGQEAVHGIVANPQEAARGSFATLGENYLEEPNPSPLSEFLFDSHPSSGRRAAFAAHYDPWAPGLEPKYFKRE